MENTCMHQRERQRDRETERERERERERESESERWPHMIVDGYLARPNLQRVWMPEDLGKHCSLSSSLKAVHSLLAEFSCLPEKSIFIIKLLN
jgi:hypothetical protein